MTERRVLWTPAADRYRSSSMARYEAWLADEHRLTFDDYNAMWLWSISDLEAFWASIWDFGEIKGQRPTRFLTRHSLPGAEWAPDGRLNYAAQVLARAERLKGELALIMQSETFGRSELTWAELSQRVGRTANQLQRLGVGQGDRVVAILPNTETALIAFLAAASIGAIWSLCAPDMGQIAILDRFRQIEPKVLIAQDGYVHAGKLVDRRAALAQIVEGLPMLDQKIVVPVFDDPASDWIDWSELNDAPETSLPTEVPFNHPLWIVYSSGTTGNPKPIVHSHGGIVLEMTKMALHTDSRMSDRNCWLTSSGWIMWNGQWGGLATGATTCLFDGAPNYPDMSAVWRFVADERINNFGAGAAFFDGCRKADVKLHELDLSALRHLGSTGSPLSSDGYDWIYAQVKQDVWLAPIAGGTDLAGAFVLGHPAMPVRAGEMQCRALGVAVRAFDEGGQEVIGEVGELVCTEPLPSMPLSFWGDEDGTRLHASYFDTYPGVWRHGDWIEITADGGSVIYGRSDATINRRGLRLGSAEIYQAVEALPEIMDSLVVDLEFLGRDSFMPLFVVLSTAQHLDVDLRLRIFEAIKTDVSARFVPDEIVQIPEVPRTLSGKKLEVPIKKLLLGANPETVVNRDAMANPESFDFFVDYAKARA
ncbi:MAG: acetoacetate--CoA ligase [Pseudomonadota bacterium]